MKDIEEIKRKEKHEKRQKKKLLKKAIQFLKEHKGKIYTQSEIKERLDLDEDLADLIDRIWLPPISLYSTFFRVHEIESISENSERYYYYKFDWGTIIMWFIWGMIGFYWILSIF